VPRLVPSSEPLSPDTAPFNSLHQNLSRTFLNAGRICEGETLALPSSLITRITSNRLAVSCPDNLIFPSAK